MTPFRPSSASEEDSIGLDTLLQNLLGRSNAVLVQRAASTEVELSLKFHAVVFFDNVEYFESFGDNLRSNVVAG